MRGINRIYKMVDTCSAEFEAKTPYFYSTFENKSVCITPQNESKVSNKKKVIILGSGPNRIGQGIEFDYSCVHGVLAAKSWNWETIMINCNPETVSTDFNIADKLYFEPIYLENVLDIIEHENPEGVIVQLGGQTALKLAKELNDRGIKILGTSFNGMDIAEDRDRFYHALEKHKIPYPNYKMVNNISNVLSSEFVYPVLVRPSYVIGGQKMKIVYNDIQLADYCSNLFTIFPNNSIIIDQFLYDAIEAEVDAIAQEGVIHIMGIMEHIDKAGIHSGDSSAYLPTKTLSEGVVKRIKLYTQLICSELNILGLINIQFVIKDDIVYVIEANPRASRTAPFISKAYGIQYIKIATAMMLDECWLDEQVFDLEDKKLIHGNFALKTPIFSTHKFGVNNELGPEMTSTGESIKFIK